MIDFDVVDLLLGKGSLDFARDDKSTRVHSLAMTESVSQNHDVSWKS